MQTGLPLILPFLSNVYILDATKHELSLPAWMPLALPFNPYFAQTGPFLILYTRRRGIEPSNIMTIIHLARRL